MAQTVSGGSFLALTRHKKDDDLDRHEPLTARLVRRLNPKADLESLAVDVDEIGYPKGHF